MHVLQPRLFIIFTITSCTIGWSHANSRRSWLTEQATCAIVLSVPAPALAFQTLPMALRDFTKLAPLGKAERSTNKSRGLSLQDIAYRLEHDLLEGSTGRGSYLLSGDFSDDLFLDECVFLDPNNRVSSLSQCKTALRILFDPDRSQIKLLTPLTVNEKDRTIAGRIRVRGFLQFPWNPYITAYESNIVYNIDESGLVSQQTQAWSKSASKAIAESFTPTIFTPPPRSSILPLPSEPPEVSVLFSYVNGRRPDEYSQEERYEIADLIDRIVANRYPQSKEQLVGKWMLVYLQPGPGGAGIDRRVPFPEFPFNDNFQSFTRSGVTNIGELFGPNLEVRVFGDYGESYPEQTETPKRFRATINAGKLCASTICIDLPISGEGLFDSVYLGDRLRIGQNLNGGGARVVQVRLS